MQDDKQWDECPAGVVTGMAAELRDRRRRQQLRPVVGVGLVVLLVVTVGYGLTDRSNSSQQTELTCSETVPLLTKFHDQSLDEVVAKDVQNHLSRCPMCREHYEDLYPSEVQNDLQATSRLVAALPFAR